MKELKPYPYQEDEIKYGLQNKRLILGDPCGLGKTCIGINIINRANAFPCLVITPASLKMNWQKEWALWTDKKAMILNNANRYSWWMFANPALNPFGVNTKVDVFITNFESLKKFFVKGKKEGPLTLKNIIFNPQISIFKSIIIDEAHRLKNPASQRTKYTKGIAAGKEYVLALTATPIVNSPVDLMPIVGIIDRLKELGGANAFLSDWSEENNLPKLNSLMSKNCFIRKKKEDVLPDLPSKTCSFFPIEISNREEYDIAFNQLKKYLIEYKQKTKGEASRLLRMKAFVQIGILKEISARGKVSAVVDIISDIIDSGEKFVLFCHQRKIGDAIKEAFPDALFIRGGMTSAQKEANVEAFQEDVTKKLIICSIKAAGVGLTLTASRFAGFIEYPWHFADMEQCEDRVHRIGTLRGVQCPYFMGVDTIDYRIFNIIERKEMISKAFTLDSEKPVIKTENALFESLLEDV